MQTNRTDDAVRGDIHKLHWYIYYPDMQILFIVFIKISNELEYAFNVIYFAKSPLLSHI